MTNNIYQTINKTFSVQHLAPVIEAVSDASADNDETEEAMSPLPNRKYIK